MSDQPTDTPHAFNVHHTGDTKPTPVTWPLLADAETDEYLLELHDWVLWLTHRYHLDPRTIPDCWPAHGELVEELSALRGGWCTANTWASTGADTLHWHAEFAAARDRLIDWVARTGCRPGHHRHQGQTP